MKKEAFLLMSGLVLKQPWLVSKLEDLYEILYSECSEDASRDLICELLDRFLYVDTAMHHAHMVELALEIVSEPGIDDASTQVVAMCADWNADSSLEILYNLKPLMEGHGWRQYSLVNRYSHALKTYNSKKQKNIILVDDFVGSGQTVLGRIKTIKAQFEGSGIADYNIMVKVLASTQAGFDRVVGEGVKITTQKIIKKGIDDFYDSLTAAEHRKRMLAIEELLSPEYMAGEKLRKLPSMGYNEAQATYCRENSNTPNSVFPVFWWPFKVDGSERKIVLTRAMGDA
ncbi:MULTISPECIES: phosphoribosyltransferase-like protein [Pseudomonas chlororaphis group]|uniref:phosphoribosyltransferase-like protein n=1 Tax=Pseudomonas chlororaphis group TaxID=136842 RepID=UPI000B1ABF17|nr:MULTISPECIES: hypothetical protein [Pseudomonas chlororaphis group]MCO7573418.1 hypothetical protein [Pseudomonas chlororaphis]MCO7591188.1 hypothetical protein [Pseudomonas chlororaphis]